MKKSGVAMRLVSMARVVTVATAPVLSAQTTADSGTPIIKATEYGRGVPRIALCGTSTETTCGMSLIESDLAFDALV